MASEIAGINKVISMRLQCLILTELLNLAFIGSAFCSIPEAQEPQAVGNLDLAVQFYKEG
jgi:hypothetical protein